MWLKCFSSFEFNGQVATDLQVLNLETATTGFIQVWQFQILSFLFNLLSIGKIPKDRYLGHLNTTPYSYVIIYPLQYT